MHPVSGALPMSRTYDPIAIARQFRFVREIPQNKGQRVEAIQRWCGGNPGDSWCMYFVSLVLDLCYQGKSPIPRTGSCDVALDTARGFGFVTTTPAPGDLFFRVQPLPGGALDAHHVGFVTQVYPDRIGSIAGNTSSDGQSSNGDGVYEHDLKLSPSLVYVHLPESP